MQLAGKVALVTGGGSGIGLAAAQLLAKEGARVAILGHTEPELLKAVALIKAEGGEVFHLVADIGDAEHMQNSYKEIIRRWARLDIVFANAGINGVWAPLEELTPEEWEHTLHNNLTGTFYTVKYAVPYLKKQGGSIIITSSVNGTRIFSNSGATAYSTSKAGQVAFTKMIALELAQFKVRANVICPGSIESNISESTETRDLDKIQIPVIFPKGHVPLTEGKPGKAAEVAQLVLFLASEQSSHISGTEMWIDGAESLLKG